MKGVSASPKSDISLQRQESCLLTCGQLVDDSIVVSQPVKSTFTIVSTFSGTAQRQTSQSIIDSCETWTKHLCRKVPEVVTAHFHLSQHDSSVCPFVYRGRCILRKHHLCFVSVRILQGHLPFSDQVNLRSHAMQVAGPSTSPSFLPSSIFKGSSL